MPTGSDSPVARTDDGVRLTVRVTPKSSKDMLGGLGVLPDGRTCLFARVSSPPADGKANAALIKLLAKTFRLPKTSLDIVSGATDRLKVVAISGDTPDLETVIVAGIAELDAKNVKTKGRGYDGSG